MANNNTFDPSLLDNEEVRTSVVDSLSQRGFVVKSNDEYNQSMNDYLSGLSHEDDRLNGVIAPVVKRERENVELMVKELFPDAKKIVNSDGKTESHIDFMKRNYLSQKESLEERAKKGLSSDQLKKDFDDFKMSKSNEIKRLQQQLEDKTNEILQKDVIFGINNSISKNESLFSKDERISPLVKTVVESAQRNALERKPEFRKIGKDGERVLVFVDEYGSPEYKNGVPYTVDVFIEESLSPIMDKGRKVEGTGTKPDQKQNTGYVFNPPADIKTQVELDEWMIEEKLSLSDKNIAETRTKIISDRGLKLY
jgi:hypothetical protein